MPVISDAERVAVRCAHAAGREVQGTTSPNPPVGAVIVGMDGEQIATGATEPAGGRHAEIVALDAAGDRAYGATMVVTLEPCAHVGRTGPCVEAIAAAGISRVIYCQADPNPIATGGALRLARSGIEVVNLGEPSPALAAWSRAITRNRPAVTLKVAQTLDGYTAARDGTSQWITGRQAREAVHADRARRDAIVVGTGTVLADDPRLTARTASGGRYPHQPLRVVIGSRELPAGYQLAAPDVARYPTIDTALEGLWAAGTRDVLVEGGAGLATSFLERGLVDFIQAYIAPKILGAGRRSIARAVAGTLAEAVNFTLTGVERLGADVRLDLKSADSTAHRSRRAD